MSMIKGIGLFIAGTAVGVAGSYKFMETKFNTIANEEIESMRNVIKNNRAKAVVGKVMGEEIVPVKENDNEKIELEPIEPLIEKNNDIASAYKNVSGSGKRIVNKPKERVNYNAMSEEDEKENENEYDEPKLEPGQLPDGPIIISTKSFVEDYDNYDKITLNYYADNHVMVDDNNEVMNNYTDDIGVDTTNHFGDFDCGKNLLYVRNDKLEIDYEIIKLDERFE